VNTYTVRVCRVLVMMGALGAGVGLPASAQPRGVSVARPPAVDVRGSVVFVPPTSGGTIVSEYAPPMVNGTGNGEASLRLAADTTRTWGFDGGLRVFLTPRVGIEVAGGRGRAELTGANGEYRTAMTYVSRQPPNYEPVTVSYRRSFPWPDTTGEHRMTWLASGPVVRWTSESGRTSGTVSGGAGLRRYGGHARSLAYTAFRLGGHSTLFYSQHRVEVEPKPVWHIVPYVAADGRVAVTRRVGVVAGVRVFPGAAAHDAPVRVAVLVDPDEDIFVPALTTVQITLEPGASARFAAPRWQAFAGLSLAVH